MALIFSKEEAKKLLGEYKEYDSDYGTVIKEKERQTLEIQAAAKKAAYSAGVSETIVEALKHEITEAPDQPEVQALQDMLAKYQYFKNSFDQAQTLYNENYRDLGDLIGKVKPAANPVIWFFTRAAKKKEAEDAFYALDEYREKSLIPMSRCKEEVEYAKSQEGGWVPSGDLDEILKETAEKHYNARYSIKGVIEILLEHRRLFEMLKSREKVLLEQMESIKDNVVSATDALKARTAIQQLREQDVDVLSQAKKELRIKLLREAGYRNLADIQAASVYNLSSISGIILFLSGYHS